MAQNLAGEELAVAPSYVFAGVGGYSASKEIGLAGVFRCATHGRSLRLYVRRLDYLGPLVDFVGNEFAEIAGR